MSNATIHKLDVNRAKRSSFPDSCSETEDLNVEIYFGLEGPRQLGPEWRELVNRAHGSLVFQTHEFTSTWIESQAVNKCDSLVTIGIRSQGRLVLVFPFYVKRSLIGRNAVPAGFPVSQYDDIPIDPLADKEAACEALLRALRTHCDVDLLLMTRIRDDSVINGLLCKQAIPLCKEDSAPFADVFATGPEAYYASRKRAVRKELRRHRRHIEAIGPIEVERARDTAQVQSWIEEALALKKLWLVETGRISHAFLSRSTAVCIKTMAWRYGRNDGGLKFEVFRLTVGSQTAAIAIGFLHNRTFTHYLGAYDLRFGSCSPGAILQAHLIANGMEFGIQRFDMLAPTARNKLEWGTGAVSVQDLAVPLTDRGRFAARFVCLGLGAMASRFFYNLPLRVRKFLARRTLRI